MRARYDDGGPPEPDEDPSIGVIEDIAAEAYRQEQLRHGGNTRAHDATVNTDNDFICITLAYLGRAARKVFRNERENQGYRDNLIKAAATLVSAIVAHDTRGDYASEPEPYPSGPAIDPDDIS